MITGPVTLRRGCKSVYAPVFERQARNGTAVPRLPIAGVFHRLPSLRQASLPILVRTIVAEEYIGDRFLRFHRSSRVASLSYIAANLNPLSGIWRIHHQKPANVGLRANGAAVHVLQMIQAKVTRATIVYFLNQW